MVMTMTFLPSHGPKVQILLTTPEAAQHLGYTAETLRSWRKRGDGPPWIRQGSSVRYVLDELLAWEARTSQMRGYCTYVASREMGGNVIDINEWRLRSRK
jgi:predicted DNA-binding transcriptional regulator AlpA